MIDGARLVVDLANEVTCKPLFQLMHDLPAEVAIQNGQPLRVSGIANIGGVMHHWHWGNFALNLSGGQAADRIYLMIEHDKLADIIHEATFQAAIRVSGFVDEDEPEDAVLARRLRKNGSGFFGWLWFGFRFVLLLWLLSFDPFGDDAEGFGHVVVTEVREEDVFEGLAGFDEVGESLDG